MFCKKFAAVLTALLMLASSFTFPASALRDPGPDGGAELREHEDFFCSPGTSISMTDVSESYPVTEHTDENGMKYIETGNYHAASSYSGIRTERIRVSEGEKVSFKFWYETEANFDFFEFIVVGGMPGEPVFSYSGSSDGWQEYVYQFGTGGEYYFEWRYTKDSRTDTGADCVRLADLRISSMEEAYLTMAAAKPGCGSASLMIASMGNSTFKVKHSSSTAHPYYVYSGNKGLDSSSSLLIARAYLRAGWELQFDYAYQTEEESDVFSFSYMLESEIVEAASWSGSDDYNWHSYAFEAPEDGFYTFLWAYTKDSEGSVGQDVVCLDNITVGGENYDTNYELLIDTASDIGRFNTAPGDASFRYIGVTTASGKPILANSNRWVDNSASMLETVINMDEGETFSFKYFVWSEAGHDVFRFYIDGVDQFAVSGSDNFGWNTYNWTAPRRGSFEFKWVYEKDEAGYGGNDVVYLCDFNYEGTLNGSLELSDCVNAEGSDIIVGSAVDYGFMPYILSDGSTCAISRNSLFRGLDASAETLPVTIEAGQAVNFNYFVDACETGGEFTFTVRGEDMEPVYEAVLSAEDWTDFYYIIDETAEYTLEWVYTTGDTVDLDCSDRAGIKDLQIVDASVVPTPEPTAEPTETPEPTEEPIETPEPTEPIVTPAPFVPGDANGDGAVDVTDALLALRYAMGLVDELPDLTAADMNGDGTVDMTDALAILRTAMGII